MSNGTRRAHRFRIILTTVYICEKGVAEEGPIATFGEVYFQKNPKEHEALRKCFTTIAHKALSERCLSLSFDQSAKGAKSSKRLRDLLKGGRTRSYWESVIDNLSQKYREEKQSRSGAIFFSLFILEGITYFATVRFNFESDALQIMRKESSLSAISDIIVYKRVKKCLLYPYIERMGNRRDYSRALVYESGPSRYFRRFFALDSVPTRRMIAQDMRKKLTGPNVPTVQIEPVVAALSKQVSQVRVPFAAPPMMTVDIDGLEIRFRLDEIGKKIFFCVFRGRKVGLIVGASFAPKYGGESLAHEVTKVEAVKVDDLNSLVK